ncbi:MAG TPA: GNAT family N-acetyltransferase [Caulobacteraceae bacterium]
MSSEAKGPGVRIHALSPDRLDDFLAFFDGEAFSDNPKWSSCYCQCFYEDHREVDWNARSGAENRRCAVRRARNGSMQGYLAYLSDRVVGWCNAAPRPLLHALDDEPIADAAETGTILCFLVAPDARGQGIARALLDAASDGLRAQGLQRVEANPRTGDVSPAQNHFGPLNMYLAAGFARGLTDPDGSVWVSKPL